MDLKSQAPRLKDVYYSQTTNSGSQLQIPQEELAWIEGENEITRCKNTIWISYCRSKIVPIEGSLLLTNFRLRFLPTDLELRNLSQENKLLSRFDVVLYNVESIFKIKKKKRKQLFPGCLLKEKVEKIEILCKNFQTVLLDMGLTEEDENNCLIYLLIEAVITSQTDSLMVYAKHSDESYIDECNLELYWSKLLEKCNEGSYKVVTCNESFHVTDSLPKCFVVPSALSPKDVVGTATKFVNNRCPCWSYTHKPTGAALVRMSYKAPGIISGNVEEKIYNSIRSSHPSREYPRLFDLTADLPSLTEIQSSYLLLQQMCIHDSTKDWTAADAKWLSQLETCKWMEIISKCLVYAQKISQVLSAEGLSVIIKECCSVDLSPIVSCLVQLMLNQECRTIKGFQTLVKREWLALGHKFAQRLQSKSFTHSQDNDCCPVFLLFLDCVHQMVRFKSWSFEFNSCYLVNLWHCVCQGLFRDLLFSSPKDLFYTTMKVQMDFRNGATFLRKMQLDRTVGSCLSQKNRLDSGVMGTLMRKSHLDFSSLKKQLNSMGSFSHSQSIYTPNNQFSYDSYSLKKSRSQLSKLSSYSINKSPNMSSHRKSQFCFTSISTCDGNWSDFSNDLPTLKKSSLSQQRLNSSQIYDQSNTSYGNPWTDFIGEISREGSTRLWDWSFLYEFSQLQLFKSYEFIIKQNSTASSTKLLNGTSPYKTGTQPSIQKSALILKGQKISNFSSFIQKTATGMTEFSDCCFSVPCLVFWFSCHLRFHPSYTTCRSVSFDSKESFMPPASADINEDPYMCFNLMNEEIIELEKCLGRSP